MANNEPHQEPGPEGSTAARQGTEQSESSAAQPATTSPAQSKSPGDVAEGNPTGDGFADEPPTGGSDAGAPLAQAPRGQRRITRDVHTVTTTSETETHETSTEVEDIPLVPPVYAAPATRHPRPVG